MKKVNLVGIEDATYTKDGRTLVAVRLHFTEEFFAPNLGYRAFNEYVPNAVPGQFQLGPVMAVLYHTGFNGRAICDGVIPFPDDSQKGAK